MANASGIQHYVPQFLLRNFCTGKTSRCFAFDKTTGRVFAPNVRNVAGEHDFYDLKLAGVTVSIDPILRTVEEAAAPLIQKIVLSESLGGISADEKATIAQFAAIQLVRCRHTRVRLEELSKAIGAELRLRGIDPLQVSGLSSLSAQDAKVLAIQAILSSEDIVSALYSKDWLLLRCKSQGVFMISDNPVARQNLRDGQGLGMG